MDKQNEGIKDPAVKVIPYDIGGYLAVRSLGIEKANHSEIRRRLIKYTQNISISMILGQGERHGPRMLFCEKRKSELTRDLQRLLWEENRMIEKLVDWNGLRGDNLQDIKKSRNKRFIYGAGNLAENLLNRCKEQEIFVDGIITDTGKEIVEGLSVFAADDFFSSNTEKIDIIIGFSNAYRDEYKKRIRTNKCDEHVFEISNPYLNHKQFDSNYVRDHVRELDEVYEMLADDVSRSTLVAFINARINENADYVRAIYNCDNQEFSNDFLTIGEKEIFIDIGAYKGASIERFINAAGGSYEKVIGIEADPEFFAELSINCRQLNSRLINYGCWNEKTVLKFKKDDKCSRLDAEDGEIILEVDTVDNLVGCSEGITCYYLGISNGEVEILEGSKELIRSCHPKIVLFYGAAKEEMYQIPKIINEIDKSYKIYLRFIDAMPSRLYLYAI